jgi:HEAT repeat protein
VILAASAFGQTPDLHAMSFDDLFFHYQRYGTTEQKREDKQRAREEFLARRAASVAYLMDHVHLENIWFPILAEQILGTLKKEEAIPALLPFLKSEREATRKTTVYFLSIWKALEHADLLLPLLDDEKLAGTAARTLGKWGVREAVPKIVPLLKHLEERRRVVAANALRDLGDPAAIPPLIEALGDPVFTVRKTAARALASFGPAGEKAALASLPDSRGAAQRELVGVLGALRAHRAVRPLRRLLGSNDPWLREDAARALLAIEPARAAGWLRGAGIDPGALGTPP